MQLKLPVIIDSAKASGSPARFHRVAPLFAGRPSNDGTNLDKVIEGLRQRVSEQLEDHSAAGNYAAILPYVCADPVLEECFELQLDLKSGFFRGWFPLVVFEAFERFVALVPDMRELWFEVADLDSLPERAAEAIRSYLRDREKSLPADEMKRMLAPFRTRARKDVRRPAIYVGTDRRPPEPSDLLLSLFGGQERVSGPRELAKIGQCLDRKYPDDLHRAIGRDDLADELERLLDASDRRPVALLGPRLVGKTTLVHEVVFRRVSRPDYKAGGRRQVWLLAPDRIVSGMSRVGQWENRLMAILRHVQEYDHVLFFDQWLNLYRSGTHGGSDLSAADLLKPFVERKEIRVVAAMTLEQWRVLEERDRGFADLFHVVRVEEPNDRGLLSILGVLSRTLEDRYNVRFEVSTLPTVVELTDRFEPDAAQPGKAARLMHEIAARFETSRAGQPVLRDAPDVPKIGPDVIVSHYAAKRGIDPDWIRSSSPLSRPAIVKILQEDIVGQPDAVEAMADVVCLARTQLNDPSRPIASLLFLGPTGVGKTECAKTLARRFFGDEQRLLRFDMSEFSSSHAAAQLAGTLDQPEGLLTSAIRQQPFSVVLLDEVEKAHPDVFDLLLQVLGEGRFTDALGRTADFHSAVIILTSNLGSRRAERQTGFERDAVDRATGYRKAAEQFFRPEFFNRIDRIVPFASLDRNAMAAIAGRMLDVFLQREAFRRRKIIVDMSPEAMEGVIDRGYHPALGARAMRRAVEKELVHPLAEKLTEISRETPTVIEPFCGPTSLGLECTALRELPLPPAARRPDPETQSDAIADRIKKFFDRAERQITKWRPAADLVAGQIPPEYIWSVGVLTTLQETREDFLEFAAARQDRRPGDRRYLQSSRATTRAGRKRLAWMKRCRPLLRDLCAAEDIGRFLDDLAQEPPDISQGDDFRRLRRHLDSVAWLDKLVPGEGGWNPQRILVLIRSLRGHTAVAENLCGKMDFSMSDESKYWETQFGYGLRRFSAVQNQPDTLGPAWVPLGPSCELLGSCQGHGCLTAIEVSGHNAHEVVAGEQGTHLYVDSANQIDPVQVAVLPVPEGENTLTTLENSLERFLAHRRRRQVPGTPLSLVADHPFAWQPVVTVFRSHRQVIDYRTADGQPWLDARLPLPEEFQDLLP